MTRIRFLDMLRGLALVCIMLDHMPIGVARNFTISSFFLFDAAELFVLLSGFLVGLVWVRLRAQGGTRAAQRRFARRAFEIWRALVIGAVVMAAVSALLLRAGLPHTAVWTEYGNMLFHNPLRYIWDVGRLWMQPNLLDVLALYVLMMAAVPLVLPAMERWPWGVAAVLCLIWMAAVPLNMMIPNQRPGGLGFLFNPFGWQALFFAGAGMAVYRDEVMATLAPYRRAMTVLAWGVLIFGWAVLIGWRVGEPLQPLRDTLWLVHGTIDKWSLDEARFLSILAASWIVATQGAPVLDRLAGTRAGAALSIIGRGGLVSFIACVLLSVIGDSAMMQLPDRDSLIGRLAVDLVTIVALWAVAVLTERAYAKPR